MAVFGVRPDLSHWRAYAGRVWLRIERWRRPTADWPRTGCWSVTARIGWPLVWYTPPAPANRPCLRVEPAPGRWWLPWRRMRWTDRTGD